MNKADRIVQHIVELQYRLCQVENNLQYIKVTQALKRSLEKFYDLLMNDQKLMSQYQSTYIGWFYTGLGHSLYDRVCNSLIEYRNGSDYQLLRKTGYLTMFTFVFLMM